MGRAPRTRPVNGPRIPGPVIFAQEGSPVEIDVTNNLREAHVFAIPGVFTSDVIEPGQSPHSPYSRPFLIPSGAPFELTTARRWGLIIRPTAAGGYPVKVEYRHWITGDVLGVAETFIHVS